MLFEMLPEMVFEIEFEIGSEMLLEAMGLGGSNGSKLWEPGATNVHKCICLAKAIQEPIQTPIQTSIQTPVQPHFNTQFQLN